MSSTWAGTGTQRARTCLFIAALGPRNLLSLLILLSFLLSLLSLSGPLQAAPADSERSKLQAVQSKLKKLNQNLQQTEKSQGQVSDRLKQTESAISDASRQLRELGKQRNSTEQELSKLQQQARLLENQINRQQAQLGQLLHRQYLNGDIDALRLLLSGGDANQAARDLYYTTRLSQAKLELLQHLRNALQEKQRLGATVRSKREDLVRIEEKEKQQQQRLLSQQQKHQTVLKSIASKLSAQRREITTLKRDEQRLSRLIDDLVRKAAEQAQARARQAEQARRQQARQAASKSAAAGKSPAAPALQRNEHLPQDLGYVKNFATLKGKLRLPVRGDLINRYGTPRADTGATWRGLFIRAATGSEVKALAPGKVVFADWLRGFGNLLIIDHGNAWLSVYGNNQALFRQVDDMVKAGDTIAAVGNSGGNPESGLYFELRQRGQPINPLNWVSLK